MSKVFNMVGGGGGKNISSIVITGLSSTDTVTCTKDGKSYIATWDDTAQHWEIVGLPLGTFTVTATNGTKTKTETVLIDIAGVYEIEMHFMLWLYRDGDPCEDVTGGWNNSDYTHFLQNYTRDGAYSLEDSMNASAPSTMMHMKDIGTVNIIDTTKYNSIHADATVLGIERTIYTADISNYSEICIYARMFYYNNGSDITSLGVFSDKSLDSSSNEKFVFYENKSHSTINSVQIHRIWLE